MKHWRWWKKLKFNHTTKTLQENETHKILWDFKMQTDYLKEKDDALGMVQKSEIQPYHLIPPGEWNA